ncbi:hypothetical protein FH972_011452 [Carpinus fangiana]|uniref:Uncharacterized protein n=1 Tax=Carpinus fangiana TaxID=176857 RepID=A0A660KXH1_9ROSI|nr:hypothetical protein FH972_011452 [Carpinus fangiana]
MAETRRRVLDDDIKDGNCIFYLEELNIFCVDLHKIKEDDDGNCVISKANIGEADYTHEKAWKANGEVDYTQLTSFLEVDNSFLSPWRWNPRPSDDGDYEDEDKEVLNMDRGE